MTAIIRFALALCALHGSALAAQQHSSSPTQAEWKSWLPDFTTVVPGDAPSAKVDAAFDWEARVGDARVVCLANACGVESREGLDLARSLFVHGLSGSTTRVFAIDANGTETAALDDYLLTGRGDPVALVAALRELRWSTREFLDFVAWMRSWNADASHAAKVRIVGVNVLYPQLAARQIGEYFTKAEPDAAERVASILAPLRQADADGTARYFSAPEDVRAVTAAYLSELSANLADNKDEHRKLVTEAEWQRALDAARFLAQSEAVLRSQMESTPGQIHERALADNVLRALDRAGPDGRVLASLNQRDFVCSAGASLHVTLGSRLVSIAVSFRSGPEFAESWKPPDQSLERPELSAAFGEALSAALPARAWIDLRKMPAESAARTWIATALDPTGSWYGRPVAPQEARAGLASALDAFVFFDTIRAATPIAK